jgi:hypothetical protein
VPIIVSQIAFALGACGGLARILMPSAWNTASKEPVNWPARSLIRNLTESLLAQVHQEVTRRLRCPGALRVRGDAGQVGATGAVLDDDQGVEAPEQHGVHVDKIGREDAAGFAVRNCFQVGPVRRGAGSIPASCRICHTVEAAIGWPSLASSPGTRRCPHAGLSVAMRITSLRMAAAVAGRPARRRFV